MATISENLQTILDIKNDIKDAIIAKGVNVADSDGFATYPDKIESIETGIASIDVSADGVKFYNAKNINEIPSYYNFDNVTDMNSMFYGCNSLASVPQINSTTITSMASTFYDCYNITTIPFFDTSNVDIMYRMCFGCSSLTSVPLFDTSNVTNISLMFNGCSSLTSVPLFDTSNVTNISYMFYGCSNLTSIPHFNTSNVTDMDGMFYGCSKLTSIPHFNTSNVTDISFMFHGCSSLTSIPQFNTSNVTSVEAMFQGCSNLTTIPLLDWSSAGYDDRQGFSLFGIFTNCTALVDVGGFKNVGQSFTRDHWITLGDSPNLSRQSCLNIFNNLYDISSQSFSSYCSIRFHATAYNRLSTDDIAIATAKGWSVKSV